MKLIEAFKAQELEMRYIHELTTLIPKSKELASKLFVELSKLNVGDIVESPEIANTKLNRIKEIVNKTRKNCNFYYDSIDKINGDYTDPEYKKLDHLISQYDAVINDLEDICQLYESVVESLVDDNKLNNKLTYLKITYPPKVINVNENKTNQTTISESVQNP
jgi:hypothetical protein